MAYRRNLLGARENHHKLGLAEQTEVTITR